MASLMWSCSDDDDNTSSRIKGDNETGKTSLVLVAPTALQNSYVITKPNKDNVWETFSVTAPVTEEATYYLEVVKKGETFDKATKIGPFDKATFEVTQGTINEALAAQGFLVPNKLGEVRVRIAEQTKVEDVSVTFYSPTMDFGITGWGKLPEQLYMMGDSPILGTWDWNKAPLMKGVDTNNDGANETFDAFLYLKSSEGFKFAGAKNWDDNGNYGMGSSDDGVLVNAGSSAGIKVPSDGFYFVRVNVQDMTYKYVKMNWGIIGTPTPGGWGAETAMAYDTTDGVYKYSGTLNQGSGDNGMKFRCKNAGDAMGLGEWKFNIGPSFDDVWDGAEPNISVPTTKNYDLTLKIAFDGKVTVTGF